MSIYFVSVLSAERKKQVIKQVEAIDVSVVDPMPMSLRGFSVEATEEQAQKIASWTHVAGVEERTERISMADDGYNVTVNSRTIDSLEDYNTNNTLVSWHQLAVTSRTDPYGAQDIDALNKEISSLYDGAGVDIIVFDEQPAISEHAEWISAKTGVTRFVEFNWGQALYGGFALPANYYKWHRNADGSSSGGYVNNSHATACMGVAAGRTHGLAKESTLYSLGYEYLETMHGSTSAFETGLQMLRIWHENKPDKTRPTIVSASVSIFQTIPKLGANNFASFNQVVWRGGTFPINLTTRAGITQAQQLFQVPNYQLFDNGKALASGTVSNHILSRGGGASLLYFTEMQDLLRSGVIVFKSGSNNNQYIVDDDHIDAENIIRNAAGTTRRIAAHSNPKGLILCGNVSSRYDEGKHQLWAGGTEGGRGGENAAGTLGLTNNSASVTGSGTQFTLQVNPGDKLFRITNNQVEIGTVATIQSNTQLTLTAPFVGTNVSAALYSIRTTKENVYTADGFATNLDIDEGSNRGPRIDIFAPGQKTLAAAPVTQGSPMPNSPGSRVRTFGGTSAATPCCAGIGALIAQARPWMTSEDMLATMQEFASRGRMYTGTFDLSDKASLMGAEDRFAFYPFTLENAP